jgi:uncharacterized cupredoxin-like copper-binding protein
MVKALLTGLLVLVLLTALACSKDAEAVTAPQLRTLTGRSAKFTPNTVTVTANRPVQIMLKNTDVVLHDWVIEGMPATRIDDDLRRGEGDGGHSHGEAEASAIAGHAQPGQTGRVWFTPVQPGRYQFYCSVPGHRESGMTGTLIVE